MNVFNPIIILLVGYALTSCNDRGKSTNRVAQNDSTHMQQSSGYADVNGIKMYYEMHGQGFPLVLIHGGGSTINTSWGRMIPFLSKDHQVIALETQAHGRSGDRNAAESFEQDADDAKALLDFLNIDSADVMGFSNGGSTALQLAIRHPQKVRKVVSISALISRDGVPNGFWDFMKNGTFKDLPQAYKDDFLKINNDTAKLHNMYRKDRDRMLNFKDFDEKSIASISCPVLILGGDQDVPTPEHLLKMSKLIKNSRLCILPGKHGEFMGEASFPTVPENAIEAAVGVINNFLNPSKEPLTN